MPHSDDRTAQGQSRGSALVPTHYDQVGADPWVEPAAANTASARWRPRISELVDADNQPRSDKGVNVAKFPDDGKNIFVGSACHYQVIAAAAALRREGEAAASVAKLDELRLRDDAGSA